MKVLVVQNEKADPICLVGDWLTESGDVELEIVEAFANVAVPASVPEGVSGLVVLGGAMGANDDADHPWLSDERKLLTDAVDRQVPVFGICLGGQMLATAIGGVVQRAPVAEVGIYKFAIHQTSDPLFGPLAGQEVIASQWHEDFIAQLPEAAVILASSADCPVQAFKFGPNAYGVQFHPEVDGPTFASWAEVGDSALRRSGRDPEGLADEVANAQLELVQTWRPLFRRWAALLR